MRKLFYYELRRVLFRWMFLAMLAVNGMYEIGRASCRERV